MGIFLAGGPSEHKRFKEYARDLALLNLEVVSTWHENGTLADLIAQWHKNMDYQRNYEKTFLTSMMNGTNIDTMFTPEFNYSLEKALSTFRDEFDSAELIIADLGSGSLEAGYALAKGKRLITFGTLQSPLHLECLEPHGPYADWADVRKALLVEVAQTVLPTELRPDVFDWLSPIEIPGATG